MKRFLIFFIVLCAFLDVSQARGFNTKNDSQYEIFVWHSCDIWDSDCYKEIVEPHSTSNGWDLDKNLHLCVGICNFSNRTTCNNAYQYGYPDNNDFACCTFPIHGQQVVQIANPEKPPEILSGCTSGVFKHYGSVKKDPVTPSKDDLLRK